MGYHNFTSRTDVHIVRKEARKLFRALQGRDTASIERYNAFAILDDASHARLADAQYVIARCYGFKSWARMMEKLATVTEQGAWKTESLL